MTEHYTLETTEVSAWCPTCGKQTLHRVSGKRRGACVNDHHSGLSKKQQATQEKRAKEEREPKLF
jgi:ribosomal protein L44E